MSDDAQIRRENLKSLGLGPGSLVEKLGKTPGYWSSLMKPPKSFGEKTARSIEDGLCLPRGWLDQSHGRDERAVSSRRDESGPAAGYVRLPILAEAAAGPGRAQELIDHVDVAEDWVRRTLGASPSQLHVLTARGHSMAGLVEDGDALFVVPADRFDDDGLYIIAVGELLRIKRLRLRLLDQMLSIESNDGSPPELLPIGQADSTIRICGRVIAAWSLRKL